MYESNVSRMSQTSHVNHYTSFSNYLLCTSWRNRTLPSRFWRSDRHLVCNSRIMERVVRIELTSSGWKPGIISHYTIPAYWGQCWIWTNVPCFADKFLSHSDNWPFDGGNGGKRTHPKNIASVFRQTLVHAPPNKKYNLFPQMVLTQLPDIKSIVLHLKASEEYYDTNIGLLRII